MRQMYTVTFNDDDSATDFSTMSAPPYVLPPDDDTVTLPRGRWWEVWSRLLDYRGDQTTCIRGIIWEALGLTTGQPDDEPLSLVWPTHTARVLRRWEAEGMPPSVFGDLAGRDGAKSAPDIGRETP